MKMLSSDNSPALRRMPPRRDLLQIALLLSVSSAAGMLVNQASWARGGLTILWPTNALLLGVLLRNGKRVWPAYIAVAAAIDLLANVSNGDPLLLAAYISACNVLEVLIGGLLLYPILAPHPDLTQRRQFKAFFLYGVLLAPAAESLLASFAIDGHLQFPQFLVFDRWFTADFLGAAILTPLYLSFYKRELFSSRSWLEISGLFGLLAGVSTVVFGQTRYPLLFAILPVLLFLGARLGLLGSTSGLLLVALIGTYFTTAGRGPLALVNQETLPEREAVLQFFIAISMLLLYVLDVAVYARNTTERELAKGAMRAGREAEEANQAKSRFLANMSHEIRTPLNGVIGMTDVVLSSELSDDQRECLETVKFSADALLRVVNDILDFSKIEAERIDLEAVEFDLHDCVEEVVKTFASQAGEKSLELLCEVDAEVPERVSGDPGRLRQILLNLMGNAVKFTDQGEVGIRVEIDPQQRELGILRFTVSDTGVGIPTEKQAIIFSPFTQADSSTTRKYGGTGLGLTISALLASRMGGKIWLESEVGQGTKFCFTARFGMLAGQAAAPPERLQGRRILVVDDNASNLAILSRMLRPLKAQLVCVERAGEAFEQLALWRAANEPCDLLIADAAMPGSEGSEMIERLRGVGPGGSLPVILLCPAGRKAAGPSQAGDLLVSKPARRRELFAAIQRSSQAGSQGPALPKVIAARPRTGAGSGLKILLAEDNRVNQAVAKRLLEKRGHTVRIANNGVEAVRLVDEGQFDVVLMDIQMPEMDGISATARIREMQSSTDRHTPIIAMTAHAMKGDRERCLAAGMDGYVSKPINGGELDEAIAAAVKPTVPA